MSAPRTAEHSDSETVTAVVSAAARASSPRPDRGTPPHSEDTMKKPRPGQWEKHPLLPDYAYAHHPVTGDVVLVVSAEVVEALANSPVGKMDVAAALRPALEAAAGTLGRVRVASERVEEPVAALDGLRDKGMFVAVPLLADGEHQATFALQVNLPSAGGGQRGSLDLLRHVAMEVTVEIGRTRMTVREILGLSPGAVLELDRAAGSPADLLVNGRLIARGEVVVVDEDFGLRVTEIVDDSSAV